MTAASLCSFNPILAKADPSLPALIVTGPLTIAIRFGVSIGSIHFEQWDLSAPAGGFIPGTDYVVRFNAEWDEPTVVTASDAMPSGRDLAGFHVAPGGNASAQAGGDTEPAINPYSLWDVNFRPSCPDPRGMALIDGPHGRFWCDIYLTAADHLSAGTSRHGAVIADGISLPASFDRFDFEAARAVMGLHGKGLLSRAEFEAAAAGVIEHSARGSDPVRAGLDASRTSKFGLMQATGNMLVWGHDGDRDNPRASVFGGSWLLGGSAGSRYADVGCWPGHSSGDLGARGRCDHLQLDGRRDSDGDRPGAGSAVVRRVKTLDDVRQAEQARVALLSAKGKRDSLGTMNVVGIMLGENNPPTLWSDVAFPKDLGDVLTAAFKQWLQRQIDDARLELTKLGIDVEDAA